jgi:hypothetical protein
MHLVGWVIWMPIRSEGPQKQHDDYPCPHGDTLSNPRPVVLRPITMKVDTDRSQGDDHRRTVGVYGAVRGAAGHEACSWTATGRTHSSTTAHRLKTSSISSSVYCACPECEYFVQGGHSNNLPIAPQKNPVHAHLLYSCRDHLLDRALQWYPLPLATGRENHKIIFHVHEINSR